MKPKHPTSVRFSDEEKRLLAQLAEKLDMTQVMVLRIALREKAKREGVK